MVYKKKAKKTTRPRRVGFDEIVKPNFMDSPLWIFTLKHEKWTLGDMAQHIEDLEDLISEATPLAWIGSDNVDAAQLWEMRAYELINKT